MNSPASPDISKAQKLFELATSKQNTGDREGASALYKEALSIDPTHALASFNLGIMALERSDYAEATGHFMASWEALPSNIEAVINVVYSLQGQKREGDIILLHQKLAAASQKLFATGDTANARRTAEFLISLDVKRTFAEPYWVLANCLMSERRTGEALVQFSNITKTWPQYGLSCLGNMATLYAQQLGDVDQANLAGRRLLATAPAGSAFETAALQLLLKTMPFHAATGLSDLTKTAERYHRVVASKRLPVSMPPVQDSEGKLRVAFVIDQSSMDGVGHALWELTANLPDHRIESSLIDLTATPKAGGVAGLSDEEAANLVRGQGHHILIDATNPAETSPPGLFDYRAAPVQLAYPYRLYPTASSQIDGVFVNEDMMVEGADRLVPWLMLSGPLTCAVPSRTAAALTDCPSLTAGYVTFGVLSSPLASGYSAMDYYAGVLTAVEESRLLIMNNLADKPDYQKLVLARLANSGIAADRISFRSAETTAACLPALEGIDILLDSFPMPGPLTADAAWQGVLSIGHSFGQHPMARRAIATYRALGMADLIGADRDASAALAIDLAKNAARRKDFRMNARTILAKSSAFDAAAFAEGFAAALRRSCRAQ
jgi:protein O-GlcNAc transferase